MDIFVFCATLITEHFNGEVLWIVSCEVTSAIPFTQRVFNKCK